MEGEVMLLGMTGVMWVSFIFVSAFQVYLFWQGVDLIKKFLNFCWTSCLCGNDCFNVGYMG